MRARFLMRALEGCDEVEQAVKDRAIARADAMADANMENMIQWGGWCWMEDGEYAAGAGSSSGGSGAPPTNSGQRASEYSTTNNQVAGVDEADVLKNDDKYIYLLSGGTFMVIESWPAASTHPLSITPVEGTPLKLFVHQGRAAIYSQVSSGGLQVTVLSLADLAAPRVERTVRTSGALVGARRVDGMVHTVTQLPESGGVQLESWPSDMPMCDEQMDERVIRAAFLAMKIRNRQAILATELTDWMPSAVDVDVLADGSSVTRETLFSDCRNFFEPTTTNSPGFLSVLSFPLADDTSLGATTILGSAGTLYASAQGLYVASPEGVSDWYGGWYGGQDEAVVIHKFGLPLQGSEPLYRASGRVEGRLINQFAMDEHDDRLRVAVTKGHLPDPETTNAVVVLEERSLPLSVGSQTTRPTGANMLAATGAVTGIARGEDIRAVRFDGDRGFVVTFKKTDPLFALDLSDPVNPRVTGELHIPGFSTYMHFMDTNHLLTIGFDASDQGDFAWFTGIQLQVFDVSDLTSPALLHKETIGTRGTTSDATNDHLAFNYFPARDMLAIPLGLCEGGDGDGNYGSTMTFNGLRVYRVTVADGFSLVGDVDHRDGAGNDQNGCYNWWQNPNSQVKRSVFMDDFVYSISSAHLKVNDLRDMGQTLVSLDLPQ